jgi:hypothetical protein
MALNDGSIEREQAQLAAQASATSTLCIRALEQRLSKLEQQVRRAEQTITELATRGQLVDMKIPTSIREIQLRDDGMTAIVAGFDNHGTPVRRVIELPEIIFSYLDKSQLRATQTNVIDYRTMQKAA